MRSQIRFLLRFSSVRAAGGWGEDTKVDQNQEEHPRATARLSTEVTGEDLAELRFFEDLPGWARERLAASATKRRFEQGAIVVRQNDEARGVYFLLSGAAQDLVYFEGVGDLLMGVQRDPGNLVAGWSAFKPPYRYTSSTRCEEASEMIHLPRDTFEEIFGKDPYLGYRILKKVAAAVDHRLEGAVTFLLETPHLPDKA
jgi:signal-transduction protein with cAMP-binding, CBS, and nucleotidyltransferase domain